MTIENRAPSFDEQAALEELERLQRAIEDSRRRRVETVDEFDAFVRSFSKTREAAAVTPPPSRLATPVAPSPPQPVDVQQAASPDAPAALPVVGSAVERVPDTSDRFDIPPAAPRRIPSAWLLGGGVAVVLIAGMLMMRGRAAAPPSHTPAAGDAPVSAPATPAPQPAAAAPAPAVKPGALQAVLTTSRPVWVRVLADGQRTVERELKANERVPVSANKTIVIRAGDAGALRVSIGGQDQGPLGRDGVIANRTFTAPKR